MDENAPQGVTLLDWRKSTRPPFGTDNSPPLLGTLPSSFPLDSFPQLHLSSPSTKKKKRLPSAASPLTNRSLKHTPSGVARSTKFYAFPTLLLDRWRIRDSNRAEHYWPPIPYFYRIARSGTKRDFDAMVLYDPGRSSRKSNRYSSMWERGIVVLLDYFSASTSRGLSTSKIAYLWMVPMVPFGGLSLVIRNHALPSTPKITHTAPFDHDAISGTSGGGIWIPLVGIAACVAFVVGAKRLGHVKNWPGLMMAYSGVAYIFLKTDQYGYEELTWIDLAFWTIGSSLYLWTARDKMSSSGFCGFLFSTAASTGSLAVLVTRGSSDLADIATVIPALFALCAFVIKNIFGKYLQ